MSPCLGNMSIGTVYGKFPKISYTKVADKMACTNSADPDQTLIRVFTVCHYTEYFNKQQH